MVNLLDTNAVIAHEAIHRLSVSGRSQLDFLREVAVRVSSVVPYDAGAWLTTDPATLLQTGAFIQGLGEGGDAVHLRYADNEILTPDFMKLTDVARLSRPVITLRDATDGELSRSTRHRTIHADLGTEHELRAVFRTGQTAWGFVCVCRNEGQPDFSDAEKDFVAAVSQHVGDGLRLALLLEAATRATGHGIPGIIVMGVDDTIRSVTPEAEEWLAQIPRDRGASFDLPSVIHIAARQARAVAAGMATIPALSRVRLQSGRWLLVRASQLRHGDGRAEGTAVILEPARAAELAPIIVELYELSPRAASHRTASARPPHRRDCRSTVDLTTHSSRLHQGRPVRPNSRLSSSSYTSCPPRAASHRTASARPPHRRDCRSTVDLTTHRSRLHQGDLRQARRRQPTRTHRQALPRPLPPRDGLRQLADVDTRSFGDGAVNDEWAGLAVSSDSAATEDGCGSVRRSSIPE